jgi:hypothetical protein
MIFWLPAFLLQIQRPGNYNNPELLSFLAIPNRSLFVSGKICIKSNSVKELAPGFNRGYGR